MTVKKAVSKKVIADFRALHDKSFTIPTKIKAGLEFLGKDGWEYEAEFIKLCGVSTTDFARFREGFLEFYVVIGGSKTNRRVWAGSKLTAEKMRSMV